MDNITLVGTIAAVCTTVAFLPQVIRIYRTRHARDLSFTTYVIFSAGVACWLFYGILVKSAPIIIANAITFVLSVYILAMKIRYK